uniref:THAP-type domain-containing protein n=1 Tax=Salarias fasciatus TaxID=181472 RepID=A0A672IFB9_SALFA
MPSLCAAVGCNNTKAQKRDLTFYYFPQEKARRQEWIAAMKRYYWTPTAHSRLSPFY